MKVLTLQVGAVNFNILHTLLSSLLQKLDLQNVVTMVSKGWAFLLTCRCYWFQYVMTFCLVRLRSNSNWGEQYQPSRRERFSNFFETKGISFPTSCWIIAITWNVGQKSHGNGKSTRGFKLSPKQPGLDWKSKVGASDFRFYLTLWQ